MHTLTPQRLRALLGSAEAAQLSEPARQRLMWIAEFVTNGQSISETCARLSIARSTFHRWLERFDPEDLSSLEECTQDLFAVRTTSLPAETIAKIRMYREQHPLMGKEKIRKMLLSEHGQDVSCSSIGRVIERECLYFGKTPLHWRKRMHHEKRNMQHTTPEPEQTVATTQMQMPEPAHVTGNALCACAWCRVSAHFNWKMIRRFLGITSVLMNVALLSTYIATIYWERNESRMQAELMSRNIQIHSNTNPSLQLFNDGR